MKMHPSHLPIHRRPAARLAVATAATLLFSLPLSSFADRDDDRFEHDSKLDMPGASKTFISAMNDRGQLAGTYVNASGQHAFVTRATRYCGFDGGWDR